jgi:nucleotide-binding universal stress UspA family protein
MNTLARPHDWEAPVTLPAVSAPARILVPFDGSHCAERALSWAATVADAAGSEIVVVVAYEQPMTMRGRGASYVEMARDELASEARELASESVQLLTSRGLSARGVVVRGDPALAILETAEEEEVGLIICGRMGLTAEMGGISGAVSRIRGLLTGGVAEKIHRHSSVPVLLVV